MKTATATAADYDVCNQQVSERQGRPMVSAIRASRCASSSEHISRSARAIYVTNDVTLSAAATAIAAEPDSGEASVRLLDWLARLALADDDDDDNDDENSGPASPAAGTKFLRLVSRDVVRLDT